MRTVRSGLILTPKRLATALEPAFDLGHDRRAGLLDSKVRTASEDPGVGTGHRRRSRPVGVGRVHQALQLAVGVQQRIAPRQQKAVAGIRPGQENRQGSTRFDAKAPGLFTPCMRAIECVVRRDGEGMV